MPELTLSLSRHRGTITPPGHGARQRWTTRAGLLVTLSDGLGHQGTGEASPLPGYSSDDLSRCEHELHALCGEHLVLDDDAPLRVALDACSSRISAECPAARFAIECALLDLRGQRIAAPAATLLREALGPGLGPTSSLPLCRVVDTLCPGEAAEQVRQAGALGIQTFKVKVGRVNARAEELAVVRAVREAASPDARLRIDANRALRPPIARQWLDDLAEGPLEFFEEPTANIADLRTSAIPLALDESLHCADAEARLPEWLESLPIAAVVLKPMALGGLLRCLDLAEIAGRAGARVVISHLLDGPVALSACAALALAVGTPGVAAGLDRHSGLAAWPALDLPALAPSVIRLTSRPGLGLGNAPFRGHS